MMPRVERSRHSLIWVPALVLGATIAQLAVATGARAVNFLAFDDWREAKHRTAITVEGSELARGGGGPRCMSLPLRRAAL